MKPTLLKLEVTGDRFERAVEDARLVALVQQGWTVGLHWFINESADDGPGVTRQFLVVVLLPPMKLEHVDIEAIADRSIDRLCANIRMAVLVAVASLIFVLCGGFGFVAMNQ